MYEYCCFVVNHTTTSLISWFNQDLSNLLNLHNENSIIVNIYMIIIIQPSRFFIASCTVLFSVHSLMFFDCCMHHLLLLTVILYCRMLKLMTLTIYTVANRNFPELIRGNLYGLSDMLWNIQSIWYKFNTFAVIALTVTIKPGRLEPSAFIYMAHVTA